MLEPIEDFDVAIQKTIDLFEETFHNKPTIIAAAPGRVNLIGEHTDYNDGFVLPMALPMVTVIAGVSNPQSKTSKIFTNFDKSQPCEIKMSDLGGETPKWANYVKGVLHFFQTPSVAFDAVIYSNIPSGGGLSSSAALEVAFYTFLEALNKKHSSKMEKALACQKAEHEYAGMPCGIMDQFASAMGEKGHVLLIDCRSQHTKPIPFHAEDIVVLITNSNVKHELSNSEYSVRREQCFQAAKLLGLKSLRDAHMKDLQRLEERTADMDLVKRARHVITEIARTIEAAESLAKNDFEKFGALMNESHYSLKDDYEVSCPELDQLVEIALKNNGVLGSRMTGGGFGGCTVTLVRKNAVQSLIDQINSGYGKPASFYVAVPSDGAKIIR